MKTFLFLTLVALILVSAIVGLVAWISPVNPREAAFSWSLRIAAAVIFPLSMAGLIFLASRPEKVPDFLSQLERTRMGRGGVLFAFDCNARDGWAWIEIHYQNRFANPAQVAVALVPSQSFLMKQIDVESVGISFECGAAAYGVIRVPIAVKREYQGSKQMFDVASRDQYPNGHGECLRNVVGAEISTLGCSVFRSNALSLARFALTSHLPNIRWQSRVKFLLPEGVAETEFEIPDLFHHEQWTLAENVAPDSVA